MGLAAMLLTLAIGVPIAAAVDEVTLTTPFPAVAVAPGSKVSFDVAVSTDTSGRVDLSVSGVPDGWTAQLFGGGFVVDGVQTDGSKATSVRLDVTVAADASATTARLEVTARSGTAVDRLPLDIRVTPAAAGEVSLTTDFPQLKGPSTQTFTFNLTLHNDTSEDLTFTGTTTAPAGWTTSVQVSSESTAASAIVKAGATTPVKVTANAPTNVTAGTYPISVDVTSGSRSASFDLSAEITGSYKLSMSTLDGRLNTTASAGSSSDLTLVLTNGGTAPITAAKMSSTAPSGWKVEFEPAQVDVAPNAQAEVVAHITPSSDAIAGDYMATFKADSENANASADIRVTVETSLLWGIVGIGLIALALGGLWWTFRRFGRR